MAHLPLFSSPGRCAPVPVHTHRPITPPAKVPATAHIIVVVVELARRRKIDIDALLKNTGLVEGQLRSPSLSINRAQELQVFANLMRLTNDASVGLAIGREMHVSCFGLPGYTMLVSGTMREALKCLSLFPLLMGLYFDVTVIEADGRIEIVIDGYGYDAALESMCSDMCLAAMIAVVEDLHGGMLAPLEVALRSAAPVHAAAQQQVYGCPIRYGAQKNSIAFPAAPFVRPCPLANAVSFHAMSRQCADLEREWAIQATSDLATRTRQLLAQDLTTWNSIGRVASHLCVTERTLRRRLKSEGQTFQQLIDEIRRQRAAELLGRGMKVADVAETLGYSDSASFRHAFRRWAGVPPSRFRERADAACARGPALRTARHHETSVTPPSTAIV